MIKISRTSSRCIGNLSGRRNVFGKVSDGNGSCGCGCWPSCDQGSESGLCCLRLSITGTARVQASSSGNGLELIKLAAIEKQERRSQQCYSIVSRLVGIARPRES